MLVHTLNMQLNSLRAIPPKGKPGKWYFIIDLSFLEGFRVNNGIAKEDCSFHYASVDIAVEEIKQLGPSTLMAKTYSNMRHE